MLADTDYTNIYIMGMLEIRMKRVVILTLFMLLISSASALQVTKEDKGSVVIAELQNPAVYEFTIQSDIRDTLQLYSLVGIDLTPRGSFDVSQGLNKVEVRVYPSAQYFKRPDNYLFEYYIKGSQDLIKDTIELRVVSLADTIALAPRNLHPDDDSISVDVRNSKNTNLNNVTLKFSSAFSNAEREVSLKPYGSINVSLPIDREKSAKLTAGSYILTAQVFAEKAKVNVEGVITYLEKQSTSIARSSEGFLARTSTVTKKNEGNVVVVDEVSMKKDILSRLFTAVSPEPDSVKRSRLLVTYTWSKQLQPAESWIVKTETNYTLPFIFLVLIIAIGSFVHVYSSTSVRVSKSVSHVRTKGGEFALKVRIAVKANSHVDNIKISDTLPAMTKLYEGYGIKPDKIDAGMRRLSWGIQSLQAGEERVLSYIIYSTLNIVGRFELAPAMAVFEKNGKLHETLSNRAFFVSETVRGE